MPASSIIKLCETFADHGRDMLNLKAEAGEGEFQWAPMRKTFLHLVDKVRAIDSSLIEQFRNARDHEAMELYLMKHLMGLRPYPS